MRWTPVLLLVLVCVFSGIFAAPAASDAPRDAGAGIRDASNEVAVGPPSGVITNANPAVSVPVRVNRTSATPAIMAFSVQLTVSAPLVLPSGRFSITLGEFLEADGGRTTILQTSDLGGGVYVVDGATLGQPCGSSALSGTLFSVAVSSEAQSGAGTVTVDTVVFRDCANQDMDATIGPPATVIVDRAVNTVTVGPPSGMITLPNPTVTVPVQIHRIGPTPAVMAFSVQVTLSPTLSLSNGVNSITVGEFLEADGGRTLSFQTTDLGGGVYVVDGTTLGQPCGSTALEGTLFRVAVSSIAQGGSGTVAIGEVTLRDCLNHDVSRTVGPPTTVYIDRSAPALTLLTPNGGETWFVGAPAALTWSGSDPEGVIGYDLAYSTDGGGNWTAIAAGLAGSPYPWAVPATPSATVRVRVSAHDTNGNTGIDTSDADLTIRYLTLTPTAGPHGTISPSTVVNVAYLGAQEFTISPDPGCRIVDVKVDDVSQGTPGSYTFADVTADHTIDATFAEIAVVAPITGLAATQILAGNPAGNTTGIRLTWDPPPPGTTVEVWRGGFGHYPEYDDAGGAEPSASATYPPGAGWALTGVIASGGTDLGSERDVYYYVAYARDGVGTWSIASAMTGGVLNYHLGDVSTGYIADMGDNLVRTEDISRLGSHYGLQGDSVAIFAGLDVGPTTTLLPDGRPLTDNLINFEDLVIFALNYGEVSKAASAVQGLAAGTDEIRLEGPEQVATGADVTTRLVLRGSGGVRALSMQLDWDPAVVTPIREAAGEWLTQRRGVAFSPRAGAVDIAVLQAGELAGEGAVATVTFRVLTAGAPKFRIAAILGRDDRNRDLPVNIALPPGAVSLARLDAMPNPFARAVTLRYVLTADGPADLELFAADGRRVRTLARAVRGRGEHVAGWDGRDDSGGPLPAGVYYARVAGIRDHATQRLVFVR